MKIIKRTEITDANLISTNVPEDDYDEWSYSVPYSVGSKCIVIDTHSVYEALTTSTDLYPPDNLSGENPAWIFIGSTNAHKMFNRSYAAQTVNTGSIIASFSLGRTNSIGLLNVYASNINIKMEIAGVNVLNRDIDMRMRSVSNLYQYFYTPIELKTDAIITGMPLSGETTITVTITGSDGQDVKCGLCILGNAITLGDALWGVSGGTDNWSRKDRDIYGGFDITERGFSKTRSCNVFMSNERTSYVEKLLQQYYTNPGLFVISEKYEFTNVYGFYKDFDIVMKDHAGAFCSITIEGLT